MLHCSKAGRRPPGAAARRLGGAVLSFDDKALTKFPDISGEPLSRRFP
jgi:hypothetical protein